MAALGILTCEILELEFAHLLNTDGEIDRISVVEDSRSDHMLAILDGAGKVQAERIPGVESFTSKTQNRLEVLVQVLELGLHNRKKMLQQGLLKAALAMGSRVDALLLGYGLCGNALEKPAEFLAGAGVPIIIPMDGDHPVDDCVGLIIGGRNNYYKEQCRVAGTFFMIPGWTRHWRRMFEKDFGNLSVDMARRLFANYERSLLIPTAVMSQEKMKRKSNDFRTLFGLREEIRPGTLDILVNTWKSAKVLLNEK